MVGKRSHTEPNGAATNALNRRKFLTTGAAAGVGGTFALTAIGAAQEETDAISWDHEADIVIVGAGAAGLPAAIAARDLGASVLVVEANFGCGGRAIISGGGTYLGGGTRLQEANGVEDSPDDIFADWTRSDHKLTKWNDRDLVRKYAESCVETFDFLEDNGVLWQEMRGPDRIDSRLRRCYTGPWANTFEHIAPGAGGTGVMIPLEISARAKGVDILLQHRMTTIHRQSPTSGRVIGISAMEVDDWYKPKFKTVNIKANKGVIITTGGSSTNVDFRRIFDARLTEEYHVRGGGWTQKYADGEIAAMALGASLWGTANQTNDSDDQFEIPDIGNYYNCSPEFSVDSPNFFRERAIGLSVEDWQNVILVKENGLRFYDETRSIGIDAAPQDARASNYGFFDAALDWTGDPAKLNGGGPLWAIFDAEAAAREEWQVVPPYVDTGAGYFFTADTLEELASQLTRNPNQWRPMPGDVLVETVNRFNSFVDSGTDDDFARPTPLYKIQTPPYYAGWATIPLHDTYVGLRINTDAQVLDLTGEVIPGLYCAGDSAGGFSLHGIGRAAVFGRLAGIHAASQAA